MALTLPAVPASIELAVATPTPTASASTTPLLPIWTTTQTFTQTGDAVVSLLALALPSVVLAVAVLFTRLSAVIVPDHHHSDEVVEEADAQIDRYRISEQCAGIDAGCHTRGASTQIRVRITHNRAIGTDAPDLILTVESQAGVDSHWNCQPLPRPDHCWRHRQRSRLSPSGPDRQYR